MPITVVPTGVTGRSLLGIAKLVAMTDQFRAEAGNVTADAALEFCHFPDYPFDDHGRQIVESSTPIRAPLALITQDNDTATPLIERPYKKLADGETMLQLALKVDSTITGHRNQALDVFNRFDAIMQQVLQSAAERSNERWWVTRWRMDRGSALNNLALYPFSDANGNAVRVRIFPTVLSWQA